MNGLIRMIAGTFLRAGIYRSIRKVPTPIIIVLAMVGAGVYVMTSR